MSVNFRNYKSFAIIIGGTLIAVLLAALLSEIYLSSDSFETRKQTFKCLVDFLETRKIDDDYFGTAKSIQITSVNCSEIIESVKQSFHVDLVNRFDSFYPIDQTTAGRSQHTDEAQNRICKPENSSAPTRFIPSEKNRENEKCDDMSKCFDCVIEQLSEDPTEVSNSPSKTSEQAASSYEDVRFHATAVNSTVIEFQIWKYFTLASRVEELSLEATKLEKLATHKCQMAGKCKKDLKFY